MKLINHQTKALLSAVLLFSFSAGVSFGQTIHVNKLYPGIGGSTLQDNNEIRFVCPDSNRIYVLGQGLRNDSLPYIFTAAMDYSGNVIWKKKLTIDPALQPSLEEGYHNLIKLPSGNLVAAGNLDNYPLESGKTGSQPFLYFFNKQGDSLRYEILADSGSARTLNLLRVKKDGGLIAAGVDSLLNYTGPLYTIEDSLYNYWFARTSPTGTLQHFNKISMHDITSARAISYSDTTGLPSFIVKDILPVNGDSVKYAVYIDIVTDGAWSGMMIETDSNFRWLGRYPFDRSFAYENSYYHDSLSSVHDFRVFNDRLTVGLFGADDNFLSVGVFNGKERYYYSTVGEMQQGTDPERDVAGILLAKVDVPLEPPPSPKGTTPNIVMTLDYSTWIEMLGINGFADSGVALPHVFDYYDDTSSFFPVWKRKATLHDSHLKEAINGNLFMYRDVYLPVDSSVTNEEDLRCFATPLVFRVDEKDGGRVEWDRKIQYAPTKNDSSVTQHILDMDVAPSGCLIMGGYVNVHQTIPGYDSVGKNSWLVVLCDSVHDHNPTAGIQIPEAGSKAEILVYPNPTTENAFVVLKHFQGNLQKVGIQVCNINGRVLQHQKCHSEKVLIRLNNYASGIYFIKVLYKGKPSGTVKLVKD